MLYAIPLQIHLNIKNVKCKQIFTVETEIFPLKTVNDCLPHNLSYLAVGADAHIGPYDFVMMVGALNSNFSYDRKIIVDTLSLLI